MQDGLNLKERNTQSFPQNNEVTSTTEIDTNRYTAGVTYKFGPGVDFRGVVSHIEHDIDGAAVMLGTSISF